MGLYSWSIKVYWILTLEFQYHYFFKNTNIYELKFTTRCASPVNTPSSVLQQDLHPPSSQVPHVQVQRARDAERDGGDEGAEDKPPQGLLQLQEGRGRRSMTAAASCSFCKSCQWVRRRVGVLGFWETNFKLLIESESVFLKVISLQSPEKIQKRKFSQDHCLIAVDSLTVKVPLFLSSCVVPYFSSPLCPCTVMTPT